MEIQGKARYRQKGVVDMTIEKKLREVAKERIRQIIREGENIEIALKYDTPSEKIVPSKYLSWYREALKDEWKQYKAGKKASETTAKVGQETSAGKMTTKQQASKKSTRQTGRFRR